MSKPKPKPAATLTTTDGPKMEYGREVKYPTIDVQHCYQPGPGRENGIGPITCDQMKALLGWETESQYKKRMEEEAKKTGDVTKGAKRIAGFGDEYTLKDFYGEKIRCWNNDGNRPLTEPHCFSLAQTVLMGVWRLNLETIIISRTGRVTSGQHRGIGFVLACQLWAKDSKWRKRWKEEPVLESLVAFGGSEDPETIGTIDNVRPRSLSDVFYTSPVFAGVGTSERQDCSRYLSRAVNVLWKRLGEGDESVVDDKKFQTNTASLDFFDAHPRLKECVRYMFNKNRAGGEGMQISGLNLDPGHCAAMLYLMGSSKSSPEAYVKANRTEKGMDWSTYGKAVEFWDKLIARDSSMEAIITVLGQLVDPDSGLGGGRPSEKAAVIAKAWPLFFAGKPISEAAVTPEYATDDNGVKTLSENAVFSRLDVGTRIKKAATEHVPTPEEIAAQKEQTKTANLKKMQETAKAATPIPASTPKSLAQEAAEEAAKIREKQAAKAPQPRAKLANTNGMLAQVPKPRPKDAPVAKKPSA